jgi:tRNA A-37 threonylcarbamoyl transferase component Bud32
MSQSEIKLYALCNTHISLLCKKLLRHLPGKRWVYFGYWGEQEVVAKVFMHERHAQRELQGIQALVQANILSPKVLYHGWTFEKSRYVIVYEYIPYKKNLDEVWQEANEVEKINLIQQLIGVLVKLHAAGLRQLDLHRQNFLLHDSNIYVIDAADILQTAEQQPLSQRLSLQNLGALLAQFPLRYDSQCEQFYLFYTQMRQSIFTMAELAYLKKWLSYWRRHRLLKFGRKIFRSCTPFVVHKTWRYFSVCDCSYDTENMRALLQNPVQAFDASAAEMLKAGNTSTVKKITLDDKHFVIKRYNLKNFLHTIKQLFRVSRAAKIWRNAQYLNLLEIPTAKPVALLEKRFGPLRLTSYIITEYVAGEDLQSFLSKPQSSTTLTNAMQNIQQLFAHLDAVQLAHGDMKATNILVMNNQPVLLDLDAMYLYKTHWRWQRAARKDRERFMKNWENQPELQPFVKLVNYTEKTSLKI